jgi:hypothetical protein
MTHAQGLRGRDRVAIPLGEVAVSAIVPYRDLSGSIAALRYRAFEGRVLERVVLSFYC